MSGHLTTVNSPAPGHYHFSVNPAAAEAFEFDWYDASYKGEAMNSETAVNFTTIETEVVAHFQLLNEPS